MTDAGLVDSRRAPNLLARSTAGGVGFVLAVVLGVLIGEGWLYVLREQGWLPSGPRVGDSLPLLQLAGFDGQPLLRVIVAWLLAGLVTGLALSRVAPLRRGVAAGLLALVLLLAASQASDALARNLSFSAVAFSRTPGLGPWLGALLFGLACALPRRSVAGSQPGRRILGFGHPASIPGSSQLGLGSGENRDAGQDQGDRAQVRGDRDRVRT